jgi:hypothetical protein
MQLARQCVKETCPVQGGVAPQDQDQGSSHGVGSQCTSCPPARRAPRPQSPAPAASQVHRRGPLLECVGVCVCMMGQGPQEGGGNTDSNSPVNPETGSVLRHSGNCSSRSSPATEEVGSCPKVLVLPQVPVWRERSLLVWSTP